MPRVFRVQDSDGRGPFKPGHSKDWADEFDTPGLAALPPWGDEFGWDIIDRLGRPGEFYGSGVRTIDALRKWFSPTERKRLAALGYFVVTLSIDRVLGESENQLLFARNKPLASGAIIIGWP